MEVNFSCDLSDFLLAMTTITLPSPHLNGPEDQQQDFILTPKKSVISVRSEKLL